MLNTYPIRTVLSLTTGVKLTPIPMSAWRGIVDLCDHIGADPFNPAPKVYEQHPELDVDTSGITDWEQFVADMTARFGQALKFEGKGE